MKTSAKEDLSQINYETYIKMLNQGLEHQVIDCA